MMDRFRTLALIALLLVVAAIGSFAQSTMYRGRVRAYDYGQWTAQVKQGFTGTGAQSMQLYQGSITLPGGRDFPVFTALAPITITDGASTETVTPTAAVNCTNALHTTSTPCTITATFTYAHGAGVYVRSGTFGLAEALWDLGPVNGGSGGVVTIDSAWGGSNTTLVTTLPAAFVYSQLAIEDIRSGTPRYWNPTPTGAGTNLAVPTALTAQAGCDATHTFCSDASVAGSASWSGAVYGCVAYVDIMGNEGPCSTTANFTSVVSKAINIGAPAASTGAVGYVPYLSLSGGTYAQAYRILPTAAMCTLTTIETITPACAVTNTTYGQTGSSFQYTGYPVNTSPHFLALSSVASTSASYVGASNSSTTYAYVPGNGIGTPGISKANTPYTANASAATTVPVSLATWTIPSGYFNYVGASFRVTGKFTYTDGGDSSTKIRVMWDAEGTDTTTVPTVLCDILDTATGTGAAYNGNFSCTVQIATTGATGTALVNGYGAQALAAGATTLVRNAMDAGVAASSSINLTTPARITVMFVGTGATNTGTQGLQASLEVL